MDEAPKTKRVWTELDWSLLKGKGLTSVLGRTR